MTDDFLKIDTKKKAYELIHDPTCLLSLLYSKYGNITQDYYLILINQIIFDCSTRLNTQYKELNLLNTNEEFFKRYYFNSESKMRIPKLTEYYKNYYKFFCRPFFKNFSLLNIMNNYMDQKAEFFYKKNFEASDIDITELSDNYISSSLSSLDNITNNKTIFDKKNKKYIDGSKNYTITLTLSNTVNSLINNKNNNFINSNSLNNSLELMVKNLANYQNKKIRQTKDNKNKHKKSNKTLKKTQKSDKLYEILQKNMKLNSKNYSTNKNLINNFSIKQNLSSNNNHYKNKKRIKFSPKLTGTRNLQGNIMQKTGIIQKVFCLSNSRSGNSYNNYSKSNSQIHKNHKPKNYNHDHSLTIMINNINNNLEINKKNSHLKSMKLNYFHTMSAHLNERKKNKTFDNNFYNPKLKNKQNLKFSHLNQNLSKKLYGSKIKLVKNPSNNSRKQNQNKPQISYHYYHNTLNQIMINNVAKIKKNKTTYIANNISGSSPKINSISPINVNSKLSNKKIKTKSKNKLSKNKMSNFNINSNNVFFTSSKTTSYITENHNNLNSNNGNSLNINNSNNNSNSNNFDLENKSNKNLYVMNLKNIYNFSRNKINIINSNNNHFMKTDAHPHHKPKKIDYGNNSKKNIPTNEKNSTTKIIDFIRKSQKNFFVRNHLKNNNIEIAFNNKIGKTRDDSKKIINNKSSQNLGKNKSIYSSSSISRRHNNISLSNCNIRVQKTYKHRNNNLTSNITNKSKYKKKIQ